jgi:preprotein translocase subunit SecG
MAARPVVSGPVTSSAFSGDERLDNGVVDNLWPVREVMTYVTLVLNVASLFGLIGGILLHSGRGGGLSDMFGGGGGAALGSTAAERNLNRITFVLSLIWIFSLVAFDFFLVSV